jgi:hypothetical protein
MAAAGGSSRQKGRNVEWCKRYRASGQREKNKMRKLIRHIKKYPNDWQVKGACDRLAQLGYHVSKYVDIPKKPQKEGRSE